MKEIINIVFRGFAAADPDANGHNFKRGELRRRRVTPLDNQLDVVSLLFFFERNLFHEFGYIIVIGSSASSHKRHDCVLPASNAADFGRIAILFIA